jgi:beta-mannosidase
MTKQIYFIFISCLMNSLSSIAQYQHEVIIPLEWNYGKSPGHMMGKAVVPGLIHTSLLKDGFIADPFIGEGEKQCQWVGETDWVYECELFDVPSYLLERDHIEMVFGGLDTYADVYLNGEKILYSENAFRTYTVDVKSSLREKSNSLEIYFHSPLKRGKEKLDLLKHPIPGDAMRAITRKPQFHYGWDWGPKLVGSGITGRVAFKVYDEFRIDDVRINSIVVSEENVIGELNLNIAAFEEVNVECVLKIVEVEGLGPITVDAILKPGDNVVSVPFRINNPKLWYSRGNGDANRYAFSWMLRLDSGLSQIGEVKTGFRTIELVREKDEQGETFFFSLNGERIFARGANYIPFAFFPEQRPADLRRVLEDAAAVNMNMIRVWGGGFYPGDEFYAICDELGLLVWQDFMYACSMYPVDEAFMENAGIEAEQQVKRLHNHPCIALWCGNNENAEGWERWGWQLGLSAQNKKLLKDGYDKLFHQILPEKVLQFSTSDYWPSSPLFGRGDGRHSVEGDSHYWGVWHDAEPFETFEERIPRFMSEFGFQSYPSMEVMQDITHSIVPDPNAPGMKDHQKHNRGFSLMKEYMGRWMKPVNSDDMEAYVHATQVLQAEGIGMGVEAHLRNQPYCMGTMYWQLNDLWPSFSWSGIDYLGNWKALHYKLEELYSNIRMDVYRDGAKPMLAVVNHSSVPLEGVCQIDLISLNGTITESWSVYVTASEHSVSTFPIGTLVNIPPGFYIRAGLSAIKGEYNLGLSHDRLFYSNDYMKDLKNPDLKMDSMKENESYFIKVSASSFAKAVFVSCDVPGKFLRNFVDIDGNSSYEFQFIPESAAKPTFEVRSLWDDY